MSEPPCLHHSRHCFPTRVMMNFLWISVAILASAVAQPVDITEEQWRLANKYSTFRDNQKFIKEHNAKFARGEVTFQVGLNRFADMTTAEFGAMMNGFRVPAGYNRTGNVFMAAEGVEVPASVDWRKKGAVTPVKDQGQCGSCWAFSATGSLEGQNFLIKNNMVSLSEQNLVDCSIDQGNDGCWGGLMDQAFDYVQTNGGIDTESSYPYEARDGDCRYKPSNRGATNNGYVDIPQGDEKQLQVAVAQVGPISVGIDASNESFQFYKSGIYREPSCSPDDLDHGVLVVGYGTSKKGEDYWIVKNSWGEEWGMNGYILMARNRGNMCGIATMASYPTMKKESEESEESEEYYY